MTNCSHDLTVPDGRDLVCVECGDVVGRALPAPPKKERVVAAYALEKFAWYGEARIKTIGGAQNEKVFYDKGPGTRIYETTRDGFVERYKAGTLFSDE